MEPQSCKRAALNAFLTLNAVNAFLCRMEEPYVHHVRHSGRQSVNVWGCVTRQGLGPLIRLDGRFNAVSYERLLVTELVPFILDGPFPDGLFWFQQDLSPIHTARPVRSALEKLGIQVLPCPAKSPDLNIIENVWGMMKISLGKQALHNASKDELWEAVKNEWDSMKSRNEIIASLYSSLPRRMEEVVRRRGEMLRY